METHTNEDDSGTARYEEGSCTSQDVMLGKWQREQYKRITDFL